jgi:aldose 1-epimerase
MSLSTPNAQLPTPNSEKGCWNQRSESRSVRAIQWHFTRLRLIIHLGSWDLRSCVFTLLAFAAAGITTHAASAFLSQYSARQNGDVVELRDTKHDVTVSIVPSVGNIAFDMTVKGQKVLRWPYASVEEFKAKPSMMGIPFMGPWANRLDEQAFYANGQRYPFDMELGNVRGAIPIHGFLTTNDRWKVVEVQADGSSAHMTGRLEVFRYPKWMKQFPFAHTIDMTYRLENGVLAVITRIENMSDEPMPVSVGYHPYFQLTDSPRDEWTVSIAAKTHWVLASNKVPTGETQPIEAVFPSPGAIALKDADLDHVFSDLVRDGSGSAVMSVKGKSQRLDVVVGQNYRAMVVYAPSPTPGSNANASVANRNFICFEPMAGISNAMNMAHRGLYRELQSIPPRGTWTESFWVRTTGF